MDGNNVEQVIAKIVDEIWAKYDDDNNGYLDKTETKQFVRDTLGEMTDGDAMEGNDDEFEACFAEFDEDGSGTIEKAEMVKFIMKVAGL